MAALSKFQRHRQQQAWDQPAKAQPWSLDFKADRLLAGRLSGTAPPSQLNKLLDNAHQRYSTWGWVEKARMPSKMQTIKGPFTNPCVQINKHARKTHGGFSLLSHLMSKETDWAGGEKPSELKSRFYVLMCHSFRKYQYILPDFTKRRINLENGVTANIHRLQRSNGMKPQLPGK